jgi:DNA-directed RNA polymerase specialized sigma24 family protein
MKGSPLRRRLRMAWSRIPSRERVMLALLYFEGLTPVETARALGCPVREVQRTVEQRMARLLALGLGRRASEDREPRRKAA